VFKELFSVPWAVGLRLAAWWLVVGLLGSSSPGAEPTKRSPAEWVPLKGCRFLSEEASDGDSFHVKFGQREFIFRLYFVDAPEPDEKLKDRVKEQCGYFSETIEEHRKAAAAAKKFTTEWLKTPFLVTRAVRMPSGAAGSLVTTRSSKRAVMIWRRRWCNEAWPGPRARWRFYPMARGRRITRRS